MIFHETKRKIKIQLYWTDVLDLMSGVLYETKKIIVVLELNSWGLLWYLAS